MRLTLLFDVSVCIVFLIGLVVPNGWLTERYVFQLLGKEVVASSFAVFVFVVLVAVTHFLGLNMLIDILF